MYISCNFGNTALPSAYPSLQLYPPHTFLDNYYHEIQPSNYHAFLTLTIN